jgi:HisA/HisF family protein
MQILPVIDVRHAIAVQAMRGQRDLYPALVTPLSPDSDPVNVAKGYRTLAPFPAIYIADLDGIEGRGANLDLLERLANAVPDLDIWLDAGTSGVDEARGLLAYPGVTLVLGSESQSDAALLTECLARHPGRIALSLDFRGNAFLGPPVLLADPACWPSRVIAMTLGKVGSGEGPDTDRIAALARARPDASVFAAGGVRSAADLAAARRAGASGALIATALHRGALSRQYIADCLAP